MRVTQEEFQYLPIECPKCRLEGKVKIRRLDRTFACKKCKSEFYVAPDGVVLGERPPEPVYNPYLVGAPQRRSWLVRRVESLPRAVWLSLAGLAAVGAASAAAWLLLQGPEIEVPESLDGRARFVAEALARGDEARIVMVAAPESRRQAIEWCRTRRPNAWSTQVAIDTPIDVGVETLFKSSGTKAPGGGAEAAVGDAGIVVSIRPAGAKQAVQRMLFWVQDDDLQWLLDGKRTLEQGG
jgi:hypothetical protein